MPFAVVGSDKEYQVNGKRVLGRKTPWGIVEGASCGLLPSFLQMLMAWCSIPYGVFKWILFHFLLQWKIPVTVSLPSWGISWSGKPLWRGYFSIEACLVTCVALISHRLILCVCFSGLTYRIWRRSLTTSTMKPTVPRDWTKTEVCTRYRATTPKKATCRQPLGNRCV